METGRPGTRNNLIATPVIHDDKVFIAVGQDPEHGDGVGHMYAVDATKRGDVTKTAAVWHNTLMGLACHKPFDPADDYQIIYHAPQPRAVLQVVDSDQPDRIVEYGQRGRVKLTTLTKEFFMPGFLERDEAIRTPPIGEYPWDGVADVRPFGKLETNVVEGVY